MFSRRLVLCLCLCILGCTEEPSEPDAIELPGLPVSPAAPIRAVEALFNDTVRSAQEKTSAYENLFIADMVFRCPPWRATADDSLDCAYPFRPEQARKVFEAIEGGSSAVTVGFTMGLPLDLTDPIPGREAWKMVFVTNVHVRIIGPEGGIELNGSQAEIVVAPLDARGTMWQIAEWTPFPRP